MSDGTPSERELDGYRTGADRFIAELDEEYYLHYAGLKPEFELRPIYERHADLTDLETIRPNTRLVEKPYSLVMLMDTLEDMLEQSRGNSSGFGRMAAS